MSDDRAELARLLAEREAEILVLRTELQETNQGVVALYAELDDNAVRLQEASALKSRFLSYMSHEFKTPLGAIRSLTGILLTGLDGRLSEEQQRQVRFIDQAATELTDMVNDLLDLARVEAGRVTISPEWFDMVDLFSALRGMFKPILSTDRIALIFEEPVDIPRVFSDDKKVSQILRNFISNALKFTLDGEVRVSATRHEPDLVTFSVADTGIGIAPAHLDSLFKDFVQIDAPIQRRLRGTGLGLSLSRKLALMLGGDVSVRSELGVGSVFSFTIPVEMPGPAAGATGPGGIA